jgi:hypothetical protein
MTDKQTWMIIIFSLLFVGILVMLRANISVNRVVSIPETVTPTPPIEPTSTLIPTPTTKINTEIKWGAYAGWQVADITNFELKVGKPVNYVATFVHWGNEKELPYEMADYAKRNNKTLIIFWEAMDYSAAKANDARFNYDAILRGDWDIYFKTFAEQARKSGAQIILIPFEEMNGAWYPWSGVINDNTPAKHILSYRYIKKFFTGISNVKFGWAVNNDSDPDVEGNRPADYYPGDEYVDYIGINGFNFDNPWQSFEEIFDYGLKELEKINKPIFIFSTASAPGDKKAEWIKEGLGTLATKHPQVVGWIWFNENKEKDWRIWSDKASLDAFKSLIKQP